MTTKEKHEWNIGQKRSLKKSIEKWEKIVAGTGVDKGMDNCDCCQRYAIPQLYVKAHNDESKAKPCEKCPISLYADDDRCKNTPYIEWGKSLRANLMILGLLVAYTKKQKQAAQKELKFLKKVLKAGT